jgi:hypothetical protein
LTGRGERRAARVRVALPQIDRASGCKQPRLIREGDAMSFGLYAIGLAIAIGGLIYGAYLVHMPAHWIAVGAIVLLLGVGF